MQFTHTLLACLTVIGSANAALVASGNFQTNGNGGIDQALGGDSAGVLASTNWVDLAGTSGGPTSVGASTVTWSAANSWGGTSGVDQSGDQALMNAWLDDGGVGLNVVITPTNLTETYDLYLYGSSDFGNGGRRLGYNIQNATFMGGVATDVSTTGTWTNLQADGTYFTGTHATGASADPSYLVISGLTGATTITSDSDGNTRGVLSGFQIDQVPEPSSMALLGLSGLALLRRRRK